MGVEVREFGRCLLKHCTMSDNEYQGISLYNGGLEAELHDCTIEKCGKINKSGAVMVSSGTVRLRRCSIADNRGDGIVVQDEEGSAHLDLISCRVHRNGGMGIVMYGGSGNIVDNRIQENANLPVGVNCNYNNGIIFRKITSRETLFVQAVL
jgi:parallel beta-helix repeat protein